MLMTALLLLACGDATKEDTAIEDTSVEDTDTEETAEDKDGDGFTVADGDCNDEDASIFPYDRSPNNGSVGCGWEVSSGIDYVCGLSSAGEIACWGEDNGADNLKAPEGVFVELSVGTSHACARDESNMVTCWGWDTYGQTGLYPENGSLLNTPMKSISAGAHQTCGIDMNDQVSCMGGYGASNWNWDGITATSINTAGYHACAITTEGAIECVVPTDENGNMVTGGIPAAPQDTFVAVASIDAMSTCALNESGSVLCWGNTGQSYVLPTSEVTAIDQGSTDHYCAILADETVSCWGEIWNGMDQGQTATPAGTFQSIDLGQYHSCGVKTTGEIHCWGSLEGNPAQW